MTRTRFRLLGAIELTSASGHEHRGLLSQPKRVAILTYLALAEPGTFVRKDTLLALFWPEHDEKRARHVLRQSLYVVRKALGVDAVESSREEVRIAPGTLSVDVRGFERAAHGGEWSRALELWRGDLMDGFFVRDAPGFERWLDEERARLRQLAWKTFFDAGGSTTGADPTGATRFASAAAALRPLHEPTARLLMRVWGRAGDRDAVRATYLRLEEELTASFGTPPEAETRALFETLTSVDSCDTLSPRQPPPHDPPPLPTVDGWAEGQPDPLPTRGRSWLWNWKTPRVAAVALVLLLALGSFDGPSPLEPEATPTARPPAVAVLPFHTPGDDLDERTVVSGLHARLIHVLDRATGEGLRVIARQSVLRYPATAAPDVVGSDLAVEYLVSGTVQIHRGGDGAPLFELLIELLRIDSQVVLWSHRFEDRLLPDNLVEVQAAAVGEIARNLVISLRQDDIRRLAEAGTSDREAYDLFLRALALDPADARPLLLAAIERAPDFLLAHAQLARVLGEIHQYGERTDETATAALTHARRALEIDPHAPDAIMSMAWAHYRTRDWEGAQAWLAQVRGSLRSEYEYLLLSGFVDRRLNRFDVALESLERAIELDPNSGSLRSQHAQTLFVLRRYEEAIPFFEDGGDRPANLARARWYVTGEIGHLEDGISITSDFLHWDAAMYVGDWARAARTLPQLPEIRRLRGEIWQPRELLEAWVHEAAGRTREAAGAYMRAEAVTRSRLAHEPQDPRALSALALIHAGLGDFDSAVQEAEAALDMNPPRQDLVEGPHHLFHLAAVYARAGRRDEAIRAVTQLLGAPSMYNAIRVEHEYLMRPLRDHPDFRELIEREKGRAF